MNAVVVIPAYQPSKHLISLVDCLSNLPLVIINDGSSSHYNHIFEEIEKRKNVKVLKHIINLGKGAALKTAFTYILTTYPYVLGVVTADADGQHLPEDILKMCSALIDRPNALSIGCREFYSKKEQTGQGIPFRSMVGNVVTRKVFSFFTGQKLSDTQSGLRAIPFGLLSRLTKIKANRYEFELEMLITAVREGFSLNEIPTSTIYLEGNAKSHFRPIIDSLKIYQVFLRYSCTSLITALIDNVVFMSVMLLSDGLLISILSGRIIAWIFNFCACKKFVFKVTGNLKVQMLRYALLAISNIILAFYLINGLMIFGISPYIGKIIAETGLFFLIFHAQRMYIFPVKERQVLPVEKP
jgi:glycosyltransferase involved in cell wall biosynthesis